jgi:hypothetical protein
MTEIAAIEITTMMTTATTIIAAMAIMAIITATFTVAGTTTYFVRLF